MIQRDLPIRTVPSTTAPRGNRLGALFGCILALLLAGCESKLPGPIECEQTALHLLGRDAHQVEESQLEQRWIANMVHGCLTTPFDHEALECLEQTRNLPGCMNEMLARAPERRNAVRALLSQSIGLH